MMSFCNLFMKRPWYNANMHTTIFRTSPSSPRAAKELDNEMSRHYRNLSVMLSYTIAQHRHRRHVHVGLSICPSHAGNTSKLMNIPSRFSPLDSAGTLDTNFHTLGPMEPPCRHSTETGVGTNTDFQPINCFISGMT